MTGIENWNVLCRWALCLSLADRNPPPRIKLSGEAAVDISWKTFAGEQADVYAALLTQRAYEESRIASRDVLSELARIHVTRGIGFLTARRQLTGIADLIEIAC